MALNNNFKQSHFVVYELQLPYCTVCTPIEGLNDPWHTPVTCEESSDDIYSLWFTSNKVPIMSPPSTSINVKSRLNSSVWREVTSASETTPRLNVSKGMASRGTMSITMSDFDGDPGPINFSEDGTFFGKLKARNVLDGKKIISHYYSIVNGSETPELVGTSEHYIENASLTNGRFTISAKDALKDLEAFSQQFPVPTEAKLTADIDNSTVTIPVNDGSLFTANDVIIIDKELMSVLSVSVNDLTVFARGSTLLASDSSIVYKTNTASHSVDSSVQICYVMSKTFLSNVLQDIFDAIGLTDYVDFTQWDDEISDWNENAFLYGVFHSPTEADKLINKLLSDYMIEMWLDQPTQKAIVSATTAWKQSIRTITEDSDLTNLRTSTKENTRFSRAYIRNKKDFQAENDDDTNYSQLTLHKDVITESDDLYGTVKVKEAKNSSYISPDSAFIWASRFVQRFSRTPEELSFEMEERKLAGSKLGDIVDVITRDSQTPSGEFLQARIRAQLIEIRPNLNGVGRTYNVKALSYVPLIASTPGGDLTIFISGTVFDVNLYARAGAPPDALNITFVFDGATVGSTAINTPAIRAGAFDPSTVIKLIFTNNSKMSARGGNGGDAYVDSKNEIVTTTNAENGSDVYQSDGVESHVYLNYGVVDTYTTDSIMYAAGGGGASASAEITASSQGAEFSLGVSVSGGGGSGLPSGSAGVATQHPDQTSAGNDTAQGIDGAFEYGGQGVTLDNSFLSFDLEATSGNGGASANGSTSSAIGDTTSLGIAGLAGGAIKGGLVTVYNLAAESSKFRSGNSDAFTLITA